MLTILDNKFRLKPPTPLSALPLRSTNPMDLPLKKASKRQIALGTAPTRSRAPRKYWFGPDLWPDIAEAAIRNDWSAGAIVTYLQRTPSGAAHFQTLTH